MAAKFPNSKALYIHVTINKTLIVTWALRNWFSTSVLAICDDRRSPQQMKLPIPIFVENLRSVVATLLTNCVTLEKILNNSVSVKVES